jgi:hypothetical protein
MHPVAAMRHPALLGLTALGVVACGTPKTNDVALSKPVGSDIPNVPVPPADGPRRGALANVTPIRERPTKDAPQIGYLHAGGKVARAAEPYTKEGCEGGFYPVRPRGFVCAGESATTELGHPTMVAMALAPKLDQALPYTYARVRAETPLFERDPGKENAVREVGKTPGRSGMAVVGSWTAQDPEGRTQRLAMLTNGRFVKASDLEAATPSDWKGVELGKEQQLPIAFVVKRGVRFWKIEDAQADKASEIDWHATLPLTGKYREIESLRYWATTDGKYVRHKDVTVVRPRSVWPDVANGPNRWIDVSVTTNVLVLYEGRTPLFVTLVSTGRDRLGDAKTTASTALGTFTITGKHVTALGADPKVMGDGMHVYDAPWALELSSGQMLLGAYWHSRFGIENGPGHVQLSPSDALRLFQWAEPELPEGWHGLSTLPKGATPITVVIRK